MEARSQRFKERESTLSALNPAIEALNLAKTVSNLSPAKAAFGAVSILLAVIRDSMIDEPGYVELGLSCANVCQVLERGTYGKKPDEISQSAHEAIEALPMVVMDIQVKLIKRSKQGVFSRRLDVKYDEATMATWKSNLNKIIQVFNEEFATNTRTAVSTATLRDLVNTHTIASDVRRGALKTSESVRSQDRITHASPPEESQPPLPQTKHVTVSETRHNVVKTRSTVSNIHRTIVKGQGGSDASNLPTQSSTLGESPPPAPGACFGRAELIEEVVGLAETLTPIALVGAGGIGKTYIALTVLHHDRIKQRFGDNRRFIRCDQFPASCAHLLRRLSEVIGADVKNPEDLGFLRSFLSSREMLVVLDNAESILDPEGTDAKEIYAVVEELSRLDNICLCVTSRISTITPGCKIIEVPTLLIGAARGAFYHIYKNDERPDLVDDILNQLDFHPLSITLLATVAQRNKWGVGRLTGEWGKQRTEMLRMKYTTSLAATIEVSLASPMFQELGPDARALLGVVAFFPQGVDENNVEWLFPPISNGTDIFDKFCTLSLTYRSGSFITMLAPLRDHLRPKDPKLSPLLCKAKEQYFTRMSVGIFPEKPEYEESRWITSEDVNVEHLLDIFTAIDADSNSVWDACNNFLAHLCAHKGRLVVLRSKIEGLPDDHHFKPGCLYWLSWLLYTAGNHAERKQLLLHVLKLHNERWNYVGAAYILVELSNASREMGQHTEGLRWAEEGLEMFERISHATGQGFCLMTLSTLLKHHDRLDAAEEAASRAINILSRAGEQYLACQSHRILGGVYESKGQMEKAIRCYEVALRIASSSNWGDQLFLAHHSMAELFISEGVRRFDDAQAHVEQAKSYTANNPCYLGHVMMLQALVWERQHRLEEAKSEVLRAADVYDELGALRDLETCREAIRRIEEEMKKPRYSW